MSIIDFGIMGFPILKLVSAKTTETTMVLAHLFYVR